MLVCCVKLLTKTPVKVDLKKIVKEQKRRAPRYTLVNLSRKSRHNRLIRHILGGPKCGSIFLLKFLGPFTAFSPFIIVEYQINFTLKGLFQFLRRRRAKYKYIKWGASNPLPIVLESGCYPLYSATITPLTVAPDGHDKLQKDASTAVFSLFSCCRLSGRDSLDFNLRQRCAGPT